MESNASIESIMNNIFLGARTTKCYKIIKNTEHIPTLLNVLLSDNTSMHVKLALLKALHDNFKEIPFNMEIVMQYKDSNHGLCLFRILIHMFLVSSNEDEDNSKYQSEVSALLNLLVANIQLNKDILKFTNDYIKHCVNIVNDFYYEDNDTNKPFNRVSMVNYLKVLKVVYGCDVNANLKQPENYFYFSGEAEIQITKDKVVEPLDLFSFGNHNKSFEIAVWFKLGLESTDLKAIFNKTTCTLLSVEFENEVKINFNIDMDNQLCVAIPDCGVFSNGYKLNATQWFNIIFKFQSDASHNIHVIVFVNGVECNFNLNSNNNFKLKRSDIYSLSLFKNFIGVCSSILIYKTTANNHVPYFLYDQGQVLKFHYGIYNEHLIAQMISNELAQRTPSNDDNYDDDIEDDTEDIEHSLHTLSHTLVALYSPTRYTIAPNGALVLVDTINGLNASFKSQKATLNGTHVYSDLYNNITYIGGVNNLLPIAEIMVDNVINDNGECLEMFMWLVLCVLDGNNVENVNNATKERFYYVLSMFLEKMNPSSFTTNIAEYFKTIANSLINRKEYRDIRKQFYKHILLNENIIFKFPYETQAMLWEYISKTYSSKQVSDIIDVNLLCSILLTYDKDKFTSYCCEEHKNYFQHVDEAVPIKYPSLVEQLRPLSGVIEIALHQNSSHRMEHASENILTLYRLLTKEASPCFQITLIKIYKEFYNKFNIDNGKTYMSDNDDDVVPPLKRATLEEIMDISLFVMSAALHDVRVEVLSFIYVLNVFGKLTQTQKAFIHSNIFPVYLTIDDYNKDNCSVISSNNNNINNSVITFPKRMNVTFLNDNYSLVTLPPNKQFISKWYQDKAITTLGYKLFMELKQIIDNPNLIDLALNCFLKLQTNAELNLLSLFIRLISNQIDNELSKASSSHSNTFLKALTTHSKFFMYILELTFEAHLLIHGGNTINYKPSFISSASTDDNASLVYDDLLLNGLSIIDRICRQDIRKVDTLLSWGTYYKMLFERDRRYYEQLLNYIKHIVEKIIAKRTEAINFIAVHPQQWNDYIYLFSILFELSTFYKNINYNEPQTFTYKTISIPSYFLASYFFENIGDPNALIKSKWSDFTLCEYMFTSFEELFGGKRLKEQIHSMLDNYILRGYKKNVNSFIKEVNLLTTHNSNNSSSDDVCCNKGKPLIIMISNFYTLILSEINDENEFNEWITKYKYFIIFCIIAFTNLECVDNSAKTKDKDEYQSKQRLMLDIVFFAICFLTNIAITKKKHADVTCNTISSVFNICYTIYEKINNQIESKSKNKQPHFLSFLTAKTELPEQCGVFVFFNELKHKTSNEFMLELKHLVNADTNKVITFISTNAKFKVNFTENKDKAEQLRKQLFVFADIVELRKNYACNIVPYYDKEVMCERNDINVDPSLQSRLVVNNNYVEDNLYQNELDVKIHNVNLKIEDVLTVREVYKQHERYQKKKKYKEIKKKMFSFRNTWSCEKLFYNNYSSNQQQQQQFMNNNNYILKKKLVNHLTKDFSRILLTPILDIDAYLPKFSEFDPKELFYNTNTVINHKACDLSFWSYKQHEHDNSTITTKSTTTITDTNTVNILYKLYTETFKYKQLHSCISKSHKKIFQQFITQHIHYTPQPNNREYIMECCILKQAYHIKGFIINDSSSLNFYAYDIDKAHNIEEFDNDRKTCFGSIFKAQVPQMSHYHKVIPYTHIEFVVKRRYFFRRNAFEVFTLNKKSYFLKFSNEKECDMMYQAIQKHLDKYEDIQIEHKKIDKYIGFVNKKTYLTNTDYDYPYMSLSKKYDKWCEWEVSTLELLMYLNIYANRSYNDMMQYPVAPWTLAEYSTSSLDFQSKLTYRELEQPMGMINVPTIEESARRREAYITHYKTLKEEGEPAYCYGSHYSNSLYTTHYLVRVFPFSYIKIELQGKTFDDPNRLFNHMGKSFYCAVTQKCDVRELIPEFFFFPEMFYNYNDLNLGMVKDPNTDALVKLGDVDMPLWCHNDGYAFIATYRRTLEHKHINADIHKWFDLIFGNKQRSEEKYNIFYEESYETFEDKFNKADKDVKGYSLRMLEFGVTPTQIFNSNAGERKKEEHVHKSKMFYENKGNLHIETIEPRADANTFHIKAFDTNRNFKVISLTRSHVHESTVSKWQNQIKIDRKSMEIKVPQHHHTPPSKNTYVVYDNGNYIAIAGMYTGHIVIECLKSKLNKQRRVVDFPLQGDTSPVVKVVIDDKETHAFTACANGSVFIYRINQNDKMLWIYEHELHDHTQCVNDIYISDRLNMFVTISNDGYANVYTFPIAIKLVNSLYLMMNNDNRVHCCNAPSKCLISASPLPCFVFYYSASHTIETYSINGHFINSKCLEYAVLEWKLFRNIYFEEFVLVSTNSVNNCLEMFSMPTLNNEVLKSFDNPIIDFYLSRDNSYIILLEQSTDEDDNHEIKIQLLKDKNKDIY